jgi:predicted DsbA family dithiol-disulfide isomerase
VLVEIVSDVVCPWCFIGKRRFEAALADFPGRDDVTVVWRPYQLDPEAPPEPSPVLDVYARKFGSPAEAERIVRHVGEIAATVGLDYRLGDAQRANTLDAHRLLDWAEVTAGAAYQDALAERLFRAYFTEGLHLGDAEVLARCADDVGLDGAGAFAHLASGLGTRSVQARIERAQRLGITAVPTFVFQGQFAVSGAHEPATLRMALDRAAAEYPGAPEPAL